MTASTHEAEDDARIAADDLEYEVATRMIERLGILLLDPADQAELTDIVHEAVETIKGRI